MSEPEAPATTSGVFLVALRLGLTSFGGPIAHLGYFRREFVDRLRWIDETGFAELVALCQALPGPASSQLVIAVGTRRAGLPGAVAGCLGFTLPSAVMMIALALVATRVDLSGAGWVHGLKIAAVAVVAQAVLQMARTLAPDTRRRLIALGAFAAALLVATPLTQVAVIAGGAILGRIALPDASTPPGGAIPMRIGRRAGIAALAAFGVLLVGLPLVRDAFGEPVAVFDSFYRSGALVFGGGHVVLPLLYTNVVEPGWVTDGAFTAGYGAAQALPGPLFAFAGYLGTISSVSPSGIPGGVLAILAIFLPGFLLVLGALPFWDALRSSIGFRRALLGTNAAVVGILAAALYTPMWTSVITGWEDVAVAAAGLALLLTRRVPPIAVVALAALAGQALAWMG